MLLVMVIFTSAMAVSLFLNAYYQLPYTKEIGFLCVVASLVILIILVVKVRKMFKGDLTGYGASQEKTWKSYR
jgi:tetrahydromethanopterin S-methyltransferase subunit E